MSGEELPKVIDISQADIDAAITAIKASDRQTVLRISQSPAYDSLSGCPKRCLSTKLNYPIYDAMTANVCAFKP